MENFKPLLKTGLLALIVFLILSYFLFEAKGIIRGPVIKIESPLNGESFDESLINVKGLAKNVSFFSLNDNPVIRDEKGNFQEKLLLLPGYNIIELVAKDRFGRENTLLLEVIYNS